MQSGFTGHISSNEWRWVIFVSSALVLIAFLPFLWVLFSGSASDLQFMGGLHAFAEVASKLSKVTQGAQGQWLVQYLHTPEPHGGVLIDILYVLLGQIARVTQLEPIIIFHVARVGAALFMYMALYYLGASIWMRVRTRRVFFLLAVVGAGLGWLFAPLTGRAAYPDINLSVMYPFQTTLVNVEWPLAIGFLSILLSALIVVLRPGNYDLPDVTNSGLLVFVFSLLLSLIYPMALLPLSVAFIILLITRAIRGRGVSSRESSWLLWFLVPALPIVAYDIAAFSFNSVAFQLWQQSSTLPAPPLLDLIVGFGLVLIIALPGLWRAVRKFEPDGNQFMLVWLIVVLIAAYALPIGRFGFAIGLMIPLAYFGARALEDFWFPFVGRPWRLRIFVMLLPLLAVSHAYVLMIPLTQLNYPDNPLFLPRDYAFAFQWLNLQSRQHEVVLAAPEPSIWLPAWSGKRVVFGTARHTLNPAEKRQTVIDWYQTEETAESCADLLEGRGTAGSGYRVEYVVFGPREAAIGRPPCLDSLIMLRRFGEVTIYRSPATVAGGLLPQ
jgi:hypothetical protein